MTHLQDDTHTITSLQTTRNALHVSIVTVFLLLHLISYSNASDRFHTNTITARPTAVNDNATTQEDMPVSFNILSNDLNIDSTYRYTIDLNQFTAGAQNSFTSSGTWTVNNAGLITYKPSANFFGRATITYTINDYYTSAPSNTASISVEVTEVNDTPLLSGITKATLSYTEGDKSIQLTSTVTVLDVDNSDLASATVQITSNYTKGQDVLSFTNDNGITGFFDVETGTLFLTGTASVSRYQNALRTVTYRNTSGNPTTLTRSISFAANDGIASSVAVIKKISISSVNTAPVVTIADDTDLTYTEAQIATVIQSSITASDEDNDRLGGAIIRIIENYVHDEDVLAFENAHGISGSFDPATGQLTLSGRSSTANYQDALRSITYQNLNHADPTTFTRTVSFSVTDGILASNTVTTTIKVISVNNPPALAPLESDELVFTEEQAPISISSHLTISDVDNNTLLNAVVQLAENYRKEEDALFFTNTEEISGHFDSANGTLILEGESSIANYEVALSSIKYANTNSVKPDTITRTIRITVNDGLLTSNTISRSIKTNAVNDLPIATNDFLVTIENTLTTLNVTLNDNDTDGTIDVSTVDLDPSSPGIQDSIMKSGSWRVNSFGDISFTPVSSNGDTVSIQYTVNDNEGGISNIASLTVVVEPNPKGNQGEEQSDESSPATTEEQNDIPPPSDLTDTIDGDEKILIAEGFSPDGDGENDFWKIAYIENYPNNKVEIFNRWGNKIAEIKGYNSEDNVWDGKSNMGHMAGDATCMEGTYFYIINLGDGSKPYSGYIILTR